MRTRSIISVRDVFTAITLGGTLAACADHGDAVSDAGMDAGPTVAQCAITPSSDPVCVDAGSCGVVNQARMSCGAAGLDVRAGAAAGGAGNLLFQSRQLTSSTIFHTHLATFDSAGNATIAVDPVPTITNDGNAARTLLSVEAAGAPVVFWQPQYDQPTFAQRIAPDAGSAESVFVPGDGGRIALEQSAAGDAQHVYALGRTADGWMLASRGASGTWSATSVDGNPTFPGSLAVDAMGNSYTAQWSADSTSNTGRVTLSIGGGAPQDLVHESLQSTPTRMRLAVGTLADGTAYPVAAYDTVGIRVAARTTTGAFQSVGVPVPGVTDTCPHGPVHFTCNDCPNPTCSRVGDAAYDLAVAAGPDGTVWLAYLMFHYDSSSSVQAVPDVVAGQTVGCDCQITPTSNHDHATEVVFARVVPGASITTEVRGRVMAPPGAHAIEFQQADARFQLTISDSVAGSGISALRIVFDASEFR